MPIPLGILAAAGAGGAAAGAYEQIATAFGTGSSDTITFSSIPQDYKHLQLRYLAKSTNTNGRTNPGIRLNDVSSASYRGHMLRGTGAAVSSLDTDGGTGNRITIPDGMVDSSAESTGAFSLGIVDILDYTSTSKNKTIRLLGGYALGSGLANRIYLVSGFLISTAAVTSLSFIPQNSGFNLTTTSRFSLYGIKG
jgi:hypothetical protein